MFIRFHMRQTQVQPPNLRICAGFTMQPNGPPRPRMPGSQYPEHPEEQNSYPYGSSKVSYDHATRNGQPCATNGVVQLQQPCATNDVAQLQQPRATNGVAQLQQPCPINGAVQLQHPCATNGVAQLRQPYETNSVAQLRQPYATNGVPQLQQPYAPSHPRNLPRSYNGQQLSGYSIPPRGVYMWQPSLNEDIPMPLHAEAYYQPPRQQPYGTGPYRPEMYAPCYVQDPRTVPVMFPTQSSAEARNEIMYNLGMMPKRVTEFYEEAPPIYIPDIEAVNAEFDIAWPWVPSAEDIRTCEQMGRAIYMYEQVEQESDQLICKLSGGIHGDKLEMETGMWALERQMNAELFNTTE